jgi:hypothetical protein
MHKLFLAALFLSACAGPAQSDSRLEQPLPKGSCHSKDDCGAGELCVDADACGEPGSCRSERECTFDLVDFCGCDGESFQASGTCPQRAYTHRGRC